MFKYILKVGIVSTTLISNLNAKSWMNCAEEVCSNMGIFASTQYDCWEKLAIKYTGKSSGNVIVYPMCDIAETLNKSKGKSTYGLTTVGNCSAAIAESMGIYLSSGNIGESMCKIADKVKSTKSLK